MDRKTAIDLMWSAARVPAHAFAKMSDAEVLACAQEVATACNTPGSHELKVGKHTVKLTIGEGGGVLSTSTKAPGLGSRLGGIAKAVLHIALEPCRETRMRAEPGGGYLTAVPT